MPVIVCALTSPVKSALALLPVPPVADLALSARLAVVEPTTFDAPTTGDAFEPTIGDRWAEIGYTLGRAGSLPTAAETFPDATPAELINGSFWFAEGVHTGFADHAYRVGFAMGDAGADCERPLSIPGRYFDDFAAGWVDGDTARDRDSILRDYFAQLDREQAEWDREQAQREWEEERHRDICDAKGWPYSFPGGPGHAA